MEKHILGFGSEASSRKLSEQLGIGRNTVMLAYAALEEDGYLIARERSGYFVNPEILEGKRHLGSVLDVIFGMG